MFGITLTDVTVIAVYSALMVVIGLVAMLRVKNQEDFFLGGRRFGKFLQILASFSQAVGSDTAVGTVTLTYRDGAGGIWSHLTLLWATPMYWLTAPWYRRMRLLTLGDFFRERYQSRTMAMFYSVVASFILIIAIGLGLKATSVTVMGITLKPFAAMNGAEKAEYDSATRLEALSKQDAAGVLTAAETLELQDLREQNPRREFSYLNEAWLVWSIIAVVFVYAVAGGLRAAVWTNIVHGLLILALSVILIPFAITKLNAAHGDAGLRAAGRALHRELPGHFFSVLGSAQNTDFTWYFIIALSVMTTLNVAVQSNQLTSNASARDEFAARVGFLVGNFMKRFCVLLWGVVGLLAFALYHREIQNSDLVWGHATRDLLGGTGFGLVGLMIVSLLSMLHSTAASLMISSSSLLTRNVYEPLFPGRSEAHYLLVGRVTGTVVLILSGLICIAFDTILEMLKFFWEYNAILAAAFWCGLKWRRATRPGAWTSMLVALTLFILLPVGLPLAFPQLRTDETYLATTRERIVTQAGEAFVVPPKSIYWSQGIKEIGHLKRGEGMFRPEMVLPGLFFDLTENSNALNETIRYTFKVVLPFLILITVSLLTTPDNSDEVRRFFLRMRTKVRPVRDEDDAAVRQAYANPDSTRAALLLPGSQLELLKWDREDALGFTAGCVAALALVGILYLILNFGA